MVKKKKKKKTHPNPCQQWSGQWWASQKSLLSRPEPLIEQRSSPTHCWPAESLFCRKRKRIRKDRQGVWDREKRRELGADYANAGLWISKQHIFDCKLQPEGVLISLSICQSTYLRLFKSVYMSCWIQTCFGLFKSPGQRNSSLVFNLYRDLSCNSVANWDQSCTKAASGPRCVYHH